MAESEATRIGRADSPEIRATVEARMNGVLTEHRPTLAALWRAAMGYFGAITAGKTYSRQPALKVTIPAPALSPDEPDARLLIRPVFGSSCGADGRPRLTADAERLGLVLCHLRPKAGKAEWIERLSMVVLPDGSPIIDRRYALSSDVDAARACRTVALFVSDPAVAVAASGTHCVFCGKGLTDPLSRARGIGPECLGHYGDFLNWIDRAPES